MTALNQPTTLHDTAILGVGAYRPRRVVPNAEIVERINSSDEWIRTRSGITSRRWAEEDETVQMMAVSSSLQALEHAGLAASDIDVVIVSTVTHMMQTPSAAALIADEIGATPAAAFDVSAACAGFCYGVAMGSDMVRVGTARHALVIGVERLSDITNADDRATAFLFADGAGAVVVGPSSVAGIGPVVWGSDGSKGELIQSDQTWTEAHKNHTWPNLEMQGNPVFRWASFEMAKIAQRALDAAGVTAEQLDLFVPHQANNRITDAMARTLKLPATVTIARDIVDQGNTSAASIPLALRRMIDDGEAKSGDTALLIAFGAGLVYAAQVVTMP
ncbi:MAG: beta-ketoacyl-ACP synthase III [Nocardioidaceae bacterium]